MKYLSRRDDFLRNAKINETKNDFIRNTYELIKEDGGPFYNETGWSDSLLGRLINHYIRKAQVALSMTKIKPVIARLYSEFDRILAEGVVATADEETEKSVNLVILGQLFSAIKTAVESEEEKEYILKLTIDALTFLDKNEIDKKEDLVKELNTFKEFLESLEEETMEESGEETTDEETSEIDALFPTMVENLKALALIVQRSITPVKTDTSRNIDNQELKPSPTQEPVGKLQESETNIQQVHAEQALVKLNDNIKNLKDPKIKVAVDLNLLNGIIQQSNQYRDSIIKLYIEINRFLVGDKVKTLNYEPNKLYEADTNLIMNKGIDQIAEKIAKFAKRAFQFEKENLYSELGEIGTPLKKFIETLRTINKAKYSIKPIISQPKQESRIIDYKTFIKMNELLDPDTAREIEQSDNKQDQLQNTQNDEESETSASDPETGTIPERIEDFFNRNCKTVKDYVIDRTEADKIKNNIEELSKDPNNVVINGMDPIIEIIRLFNRAYKIFTVSTITKRSNGTVDPRTFGEYTSFGGQQSGGQLNGWSGPYRNNKIFNIWEDAVLKILGDKKYAPIFKAKMILGKTSETNNIEKTGDKDTTRIEKNTKYEEKEGAGAKLRKFITDILDGETLYKISGRSEAGAQAKFLNDYFGVDVDTSKNPFTITKEEAESNTKNATTILDKSIRIKFKKNTSNKELKNNQIFALNVESLNDEKENEYYFFRILDTKNGVALSFSKTFGYLNDDIKDSNNKDKEDGRKKIIEKGDLSKLKLDKEYSDKKENKTLKYITKYTSTSNLSELLTPGNDLEISYLDNNETKTTKFKVLDHYWLTLEDKIYAPLLTIEDSKVGKINNNKNKLYIRKI
jgi:hypothetical protein